MHPTHRPSITKLPDVQATGMSSAVVVAEVKRP